jgi:hypothetical protein
MTRPVNTPQSSPAGWVPAPAGSFVHMRDHLLGVRRRRYFLQAAVGGLAVAGAAALGWSFLDGGEKDFGGIRCSAVVPSADAYHKGLLDGETQARIQTHLERCAKCRAAVSACGSCGEAPPCK